MFISFFSKRNQQVENINLMVTTKGWEMDHPCYCGNINPCGYPSLIRCLQEHWAEYPPAFCDALEELWEAAQGKCLEEMEIQERLDTFSNWIMYYTLTKRSTIADLTYG